MDTLANRVHSFFDRYMQWKQTRDVEIRTSLHEFFSRHKLLRKRLLEINETEAESFNVFNILKIRHAEVKLHTPFIAHLLNPAGSHAQGDLFYKAFIKKLLPDSVFENYDTAKVWVKDELWCGEEVGQIDLFISHGSAGNPYAIVIENKINAGDQWKQLERYKNYLDSLANIPADSKRIFYLKPLGGYPSEYAVEAKLLADWQSMGLFHTISYKTHIIEWLEDCIDNIKAPKVRVMVEQYLQLLKSICNE